jgi:hydrogenase-4 transcriptional activator
MNVEFLKDVALAVAQEQHLERVMRMIVEGIGEEPDIALVRLWLLAPGDICPDCYLRPDCPDQTRCLHLVASAGHSQQHRDKTIMGAKANTPMWYQNNKAIALEYEKHHIG